MSTARKRLLGVGVSALLLALALGAACVVVAVGDRYNARLDVTTTGEQRLAPRTQRVLDQSAALGEAEIVIAVDTATLDPWSRRTVGDVLDLFAHAGRVRTSEIDVGSAAGQADFGRLLDRLMQRERQGIDLHIAAVQQAGAEAGAVAAALDQQLAPALRSLAEAQTGTDPAALAAKAGLEQWAALLRVGSVQLGEAGSRAEAALSEPDPLLPIPPLAEHEAALRTSLDQRAQELDALADELAALGDPTAEAGARAARELRDRLARHADALGRLPRLDVLRVARALGSSQIALVIGPPGTGITGIDISALYQPAVIASDGTRVTGDVRFQAEELLGSAVAAILSTAKPIVVLVHGESAAILESATFFSGIRERLTRRGIDMAEWVAAKEPEPPALTELNPDGVRPVVYVTLSPDSSAAARGEGGLAGPERALALGRAVALLLDRREPVLVGVNPSILPSYGEADPVVAPLAALGVTVATETPLLQSLTEARTRRVLTELTVRAPEGQHAILAATRGLRTVLSWPVAIETAPTAAMRAVPLLVVDDAGAWGESQWLGFWQTPREQRDLLPNAPAFDQDLDRRGGPWTVAAALSRTDLPPDSRSGRVVVVGSNSWFADPIAFQHHAPDGRVALVSPGNAEWFEAAVRWLAGEEELIATSAGARATPLVGPIEGGVLRLLRWALIAGLPLATLGLGVAWRLVRG